MKTGGVFSVKKPVALLLSLILLMSLLPVRTVADDSDEAWVSAWSTSPVRAGLSELGALNKLGIVTISASSRVSVTPAVSGTQVRLVFSNEYGTRPLTISACTIAPSGSDRRTIDTSLLETVLFGGSQYVSIPAGQTITSDPVKMNVTVGENITVTTFYRGVNVQRTIGLIGGSTYVAVGDYTRSSSMRLGVPLRITADSGTYEVIPALKCIDVLTDSSKCSCVIFGDSTVANEIPRLLEQKLQKNGVYNISVTQQAIKGNRLVADGVGAAAGLLGESGIKRFECDVLGQAGVKYVIVKLGVNDIIHPHCNSKSDRLQPVTFEQMTEAYTELITMAHAKGIKIYLCEISPWKGYTRNLLGSGDDVQWSEEIDSLRLELNSWMASSDCPADGYLSFPSLVDSADSYALASEYTTDGAHLTDAGQQAFTDAIPIELFR